MNHVTTDPATWFSPLGICLYCHEIEHDDDCLVAELVRLRAMVAAYEHHGIDAEWFACWPDDDPDAIQCRHPLKR